MRKNAEKPNKKKKKKLKIKPFQILKNGTSK